MNLRIGFVLAALLLWMSPAFAQPSHQEAVDAMHRAVDFFRQQCAAEGGYVYQWSDDLSRREGEGKVGRTTAWIQPPATPSVGDAYLQAYHLTGDPQLIEAAKETAAALLRGQLRSGGWDNRIEFAPEDRRRYAYRVDDTAGDKLRNTTTFDDDKSQSVIRFLMRLDQELNFEDQAIHEATLYALDGMLKSQYPSGAWPQRYAEFPDPAEYPVLKASIPDQWPREFSGEKYAAYYTLNDNTLADLIVTALDAWQIYGDEKYLKAAERGGDFLLLAQLPEPQPGWAQQYNRQMHPAWARKFEPPAVTGGESQGVMRTLILLYRRTAAHSENAQRFLEPIPRAIRYYRSLLLEDGNLARFYELGTDRPLFLTKDYKLSYSPNDLPTHYAFIVGSKLDRIEAEWKKVRSTPVEKLWSPRRVQPPSASRSLGKRAGEIIDSLDDRGAWVQQGQLRYHGQDDPTDRAIRSATFIDRLETLAQWIAANQ